MSIYLFSLLRHDLVQSRIETLWLLALSSSFSPMVVIDWLPCRKKGHGLVTYRSSRFFDKPESRSQSGTCSKLHWSRIVYGSRNAKAVGLLISWPRTNVRPRSHLIPSHHDTVPSGTLDTRIQLRSRPRNPRPSNPNCCRS